MKKIIFILIYFSPLLWREEGGKVVAQSTRIDSLYKQLADRNENSPEQLNLLLVIAEAQELSNPNKGIAAADKAIELAQKLNKQQELAIAFDQKARLLIMLQLADKANEALVKSIAINQKLNNKGQLAENDLTTAQFIFCQRKTDSTFNYINKSFQLFEKSGDDLVLGKIYLFNGAHYGFLNTDTAQVLYLKAKSCFEKAGRKDWLAYTYFYIATNYTSLNSNDKAFEYFKIAGKLNQSVRSDLIAENIYCTTGYLYFSLGDFPKAMDNFIPGLKIAERIKDEMMQACLMGNMGAVVGSMKDYKKSREYIDKQIAIAKKINDGYTLSSGYQNLGWNEYEHQNYVEALKYFKMALEVALQIKQFDSMSECYGAVGDVYEKLGNYNEAYANIYHALELNRQQGNFYNISDNLLALSRTILNSGNNRLKDVAGVSFDLGEKRERAIAYSLEALKIAENRKTMTQQRDALKQLSDLYDLDGDEKKAFSYYKKYIAVKDTIMNSENIKSINNLQLKFETEKHEQQITLLNTDKKIQEKEISKNKTQRNGYIGGCTLLLMIGGVTYNRYYVKQKANKKLSDALTQLKQVQQQLIEQEKLASLGQLTAGIAHEIQNPLNFIINFSQLSASLFDDLKNHTDSNEYQEIVADLEDNITKIERHGERADGIIQSMLMHSRDSGFKEQLTNVNSLCTEALIFSWQAMSMNYPEFKCDKQINFDESIPSINLVQQDISRVIINLLNNAFYAVHEKKQSKKTSHDFEPQIKMETLLNGNNVQVKIVDNGNGIPEELRNKIFQPFFTTKPTNLGTGLGLSISYDIVKAHDGTLSLENNSTGGATFIISIPV